MKSIKIHFVSKTLVDTDWLAYIEIVVTHHNSNHKKREPCS
jgi:hypothetical protein